MRAEQTNLIPVAGLLQRKASITVSVRRVVVSGRPMSRKRVCIWG